MIKFKKRSFAVPAALPAAANVIGGVLSAAGLVQGGVQMKQQEELQNQQLREQRRLQNQQIQAMNKRTQDTIKALNEVSKNNPAIAAAAAGKQLAAIQQQQFAIPASLSNMAKTVRGTAKDLAITAKNLGAHKKLASGLAMGATAGGASYLVDKAVQADAKRSGIDLGETESDQKDNAKKLGKAALTAGGTALAVLGAKKGYLGKTLQGGVNKYITRENATKVGRTLKNAVKEQFVDTNKLKEAKTIGDKVKSINGTGLLITGGFASLPAITYATNKKAMKDQVGQSEQQKSYGVPAFAKNIANTWKNSGARQKFEPMIKNLSNRKKSPTPNNPNHASFREAPVRNILGKISSWSGGGGQEGTAKFTEELAKQAEKSGNTGTAKVAKFLGDNKTLAVGGSIAVGSAMLKPFVYGEKAVKTVAGTVDKNSMRYEKSQNKTVEQQ